MQKKFPGDEMSKIRYIFDRPPGLKHLRIFNVQNDAGINNPGNI
jgi:hypothetical protein